MTVQQGRSKFLAPGMTEHQRLARLAAGIEARHIMPTHREPKVCGIVAQTCEHCGCTSARPQDNKSDRCDYCGKTPKRWAEPQSRHE